MAIRFVAAAALAAFCAVLVWLGEQVLRGSRDPTGAFLALLAFATSSYVVMSAHVIGYFDNLLVLLAVAACALAMRGRTWAAAGVLAVAVLVHETILLVGLPTVVFVAALRDSRAPAAAPPLRRFAPLLLPAGVFVALVAYQSLFLDAEAMRYRITSHLLRFDFVDPKHAEWVAAAYVAQFSKYVATMVPELTKRLLSPGHVLHVGFTLAVLLAFAERRLRALPDGRALFRLLLATALLPLALHAAAWDTSRLWTYPQLAALLGLWGCCRLVPPPDREPATSPLLAIVSLMVLMQNVLFSIPLMDKQVQLWNDEMRILLYLPSLAIGALTFARSQAAALPNLKIPKI
jgi:hypothetical protein